MTSPADGPIAAKVLTDTQLIRWALRHTKGMSIDRIARLQGVSKTTIRESLEASDRAIRRAKEQA